MHQRLAIACMGVESTKAKLPRNIIPLLPSSQKETYLRDYRNSYNWVKSIQPLPAASKNGVEFDYRRRGNIR